MHIKHCSSQIIHVKVTPLISKNFFFSFVYGASDRKGRKDLFTQLEGIKAHIKGPWLIMGDFNYIANLDERIGQRPRIYELEPLRKCVEACDIHNLKITGRFFTWTNK